MGERGTDDTDAEVESWRATVPAIDPVVEGVVDRVHQISRYLDFLATEIAAPHGLNRADYEILCLSDWDHETPGLPGFDYPYGVIGTQGNR